MNRPHVLAAIVGVLMAAVWTRVGGTDVAAQSDMHKDFFELVQTRHSIRHYQARDIDGELLERILEAANRAPSAGNLQAYEVVVVHDAARRAQLARAAGGQSYVGEAPVVLVFVSDPARSAAKYGERGSELYTLQDAAIAAAYAQLAAHALGLGSVWVGAFDEAEVLRAVGGRAPHRAVSLLVLGYAAERPDVTPRRSLSDVARSENLSNAWRR